MMNVVTCIALVNFTDQSLIDLLYQKKILISNHVIRIARCVKKVYDMQVFMKCVSKRYTPFLKHQGLIGKILCKNFTRTALSSFPVTHPDVFKNMKLLNGFLFNDGLGFIVLNKHLYFFYFIRQNSSSVSLVRFINLQCPLKLFYQA